MQTLNWTQFIGECRQVPELTETLVQPQNIARQHNASRAAMLLQPGGEALLDASDSDAFLVLDFGRETVGRLHLQVEAEGEATLRVFYGEDLLEAMRETDYTDGWYHLPHDKYALQPGRHELSSRGRRAFRYVRLVLSGGARLRVRRVEATLVHYPVELRGHFACSDQLLNRAWQISEWTTRLCMQKYFEDGVKRDGLLWIGDYRVQHLCAALLYGDTALARRSLGLTALSQFEDGRLPACAIRVGAHQHPANIDYMFDLSGEQEQDAWIANWKLTNYEADYVSSVREYFDLSGDAETLSVLWPSVQKLLKVLCALDVLDEESTPLNSFITDDQPDHDGWWSSRGALAAQLHQAVRDALALAQHLGDVETAALCSSYLERSREMFQQFYSPGQGAFCDEPPLGDANARVGWHVNAFAVLSGLVEEPQPLLQNVDANPSARYPGAGFMEFYRLQSTFEAGLAVEALAEIRRYWGHMLRYDATSCWDCCDTRLDGIARPETHAMSHCHGWSAGPAYLLPVYVLGVQPVEPGFASVRIKPQLGDLTWAEGTVPTPHGDIKVRWENDNGLRGRIVLPPNTSGEVLWKGERRTLHHGENIIS